jgi:uncharacterized membrane protein YphA (DoxX/SURF4 family)
MNIALWTLQVLWAVFFIISGFGKICWYNTALWNQARHEVPWASAVPQALLIFIGTSEFLGGIGLILPAATGVRPKLTAFAGFGLTLAMILAAVFHIARGEYPLATVNLVLGGVAAFVGYERFFVKPIAPSTLSAFRVLKGVAVLGALVLVGVAPVWYRLSQMH